MPKRKSTYEGTPVTRTVRLSAAQDKRLRKDAATQRTHVSKILREILDKHYEVAA